MNPPIPITTLYACIAIGLLATNALLAMLLMRYLSRDNADLPIKANKVADLAGWLMFIYLAGLAGLAYLLAFLAK